MRHGPVRVRDAVPLGHILVLGVRGQARAPQERETLYLPRRSCAPAAAPPGDGGGRLARPLVRGPVRTDAAAVDGNALQVIPLKVAHVDDDPVDPRRPLHPKLEQGPVRQTGLLQPRRGVPDHHRGTIGWRADSHPSFMLAPGPGRRSSEEAP